MRTHITTQTKTNHLIDFRKIGFLALCTFVLFASHLNASFARGALLSFADLAEEVQPAVVNITVETTVSDPARRMPRPQFPEGSPFEDFFRDFFDNNNEPNTPRRRGALGSGFIISEDGYVVTNNHVIEGADDIEVELFSGESYAARLIGRDPKIDIAVLKIEAEEPLPFVALGDSDVARVGDWVMAVGNPLGQGFSVSTGIISARNRDLDQAFADFIQTDAAINQGNSGGPLFNLDGEVIGVNTLIISQTGGSVGLGFAMASNTVGPVVEQLIEFGETRRGWLGVGIQTVTSDTAEALGLSIDGGVLVSTVFEGSPAAKAGLRQRDVIVEFDGQKIMDDRSLIKAVSGTPVGTRVDVVIYRDAIKQTVVVDLGHRELAEAALNSNREPSQSTNPVQGDEIGLSLTPITPSLRERFNIAEDKAGLIVTKVAPQSDAEEKGIAVGDLILEAGPKRVMTLAEFREAIEDARSKDRKSILLLIERQGNSQFVALSIGK